MKTPNLIDKYYLQLEDLLEGKHVFIRTDEELVEALIQLAKKQKRTIQYLKTDL